MVGSRGVMTSVLLLAMLAGVAAAVQLRTSSGSADGVAAPETLPKAAAANDKETSAVSSSSGESQKTFPVNIRKPAGPPRVATNLKDFHGVAVTVACSTCHSTRSPNLLNKTPQSLDEFHSGMKFSHGTVSCLSCHNAADYDSLQLADGHRVEFTDVMTLCGQCHGPQMRDFEHGVHGGLNGYWDLSRGPQQKNNCVDCHNPHTPQFPKMQPTFKPKDRFLEQSRSEH
jgi:hypothetical protein